MNNDATAERVKLTYDEKIEKVLSHIQNVQRNCIKLGVKFIKGGYIELGRNLIANGMIHDNSKFKGIEFERLFSGDPLLEDVVKHHSSTNPHHPEYWGRIQDMPNVYLAEMACDLVARSQEFGTDVREWVKNKATAKYNFTMEDPVGLKLVEYIDMILERPFNS